MPPKSLALVAACFLARDSSVPDVLLPPDDAQPASPTATEATRAAAARYRFFMGSFPGSPAVVLAVQDIGSRGVDPCIPSGPPVTGGVTPGERAASRERRECPLRHSQRNRHPDPRGDGHRADTRLRFGDQEGL